MLAGVAPIPANSGQVTTRYRLNRYGDRHLNTALHTVVQIRIQYQPATRDYVARRTAEGKTSREIKRCLARYVARDLYRLLAGLPLPGRPFRAENVLVPSGDVGSLCSVEGVY
jgi:transposase